MQFQNLGKKNFVEVTPFLMLFPCMITTWLKKNQIYSLDKGNCKELYCLQISLNNPKTRSQLYFEDLFQMKDIDWKHVHLLPRRVTVNTNLRVFQYNILNNVLYLNEKLIRFKKISYPLCSFCQSENETPFSWLH